MCSSYVAHKSCSQGSTTCKNGKLRSGDILHVGTFIPLAQLLSLRFIPVMTIAIPLSWQRGGSRCTRCSATQTTFIVKDASIRAIIIIIIIHGRFHSLFLRTIHSKSHCKVQASGGKSAARAIASCFVRWQQWSEACAYRFFLWCFEETAGVVSLEICNSIRRKHTKKYSFTVTIRMHQMLSSWLPRIKIIRRDSTRSKLWLRFISDSF